VALGVAALIALAGCTERLPDPIPAAHPDDATPRRGGTIRMASFADIRGLDPTVVGDAFSAGIVAQIFSGLVDFDVEGKVVPDLAERVDVTPDGLTYTFPMRHGVVMHDGNELVADDVVRSIERALHPDTPNAFASFYESIAGFREWAQRKTPHLSGVRAEGRWVVSVTLSRRDAMFLSAFALPPMRPVCRSAGDRYDDTWMPCGAGPFRIPEGGWDRGRSLVLARHDAFYRPGEPYLDRIVWTFGMNAVTQRYKLEVGELDGDRELLLPDALRFSGDPRWKPFGVFETDAQIGAVNMNVEMPPFDNVEVRRAVAAAIDRDALRLLRTPNVRAAGRVLPPPIAGNDPSFPAQRYDPKAALDHMARAGLAYDPVTKTGGWPHPITYLVTRQGLDEGMAQVLQQQLARIGIRLEIRLVNFPTFLSLTRRRKQAAISPQGWVQDFPDAGDFLEPMFSTGSINDEDSNNTSFYSNPRVDDLLAKARGELDPARRKSLYREVDAIVCDEAPWAPIYTYRFYAVHQPYVRGYVPNAVWSEDHRRTWLDRGAAEAKKHAGVLGQGGAWRAFGSILGGRP
jgi:ABC-type transport system substrate-binding protein